MRAVKVGNTAIGTRVVLIPKDGTAIVHGPRVDHACNPGTAPRARGVVDGFGKRVSRKELRALRNPACQAELKGIIGRFRSGLIQAESVDRNTLKWRTQDGVCLRIRCNHRSCYRICDWLLRTRQLGLVDRDLAKKPPSFRPNVCGFEQ